MPDPHKKPTVEPVRLGRSFFLRDGVTVARELVGKILVRKIGQRCLRCRIVETEAYMGPEDRASHAYGNRKSSRTAVLYGPGGVLYVYLIYGMHPMCNVVTNVAGIPQAVLLRAARPLDGLESAMDGPGKLCHALRIDMGFYGYDLAEGGKLWVADDGLRPRVASSPRVNIDYAGDHRDKPWRFTPADVTASVSPPGGRSRRTGP